MNNKKKYPLKKIQNLIAKIIYKKKFQRNFLNKNILKQKEIDSFTMIKIIIIIEKKFKIKFKDSEIFSSKFKNISGISSLIQKKISKI